MIKIFKLKGYKCPNGLPPEECKHVQQLIINISNYFINKKQLKQDSKLVVTESKSTSQVQQTSAQQQRQRTRG